jgi:hypothetical protein
MSFLFLSILAGLVTYALAQKMSDRFTVSATCNGKQVDPVLQEAIDMAEVASKAIDTLLNARLIPLWTNKNTYRLVDIASQIWGIHLDVGKLSATYGPEAQEMLKLIQGIIFPKHFRSFTNWPSIENYQWAINAMKYGERGVPAVVNGEPEDVSKLPSIDASNSFFWCDSSPFKYTKVGHASTPHTNLRMDR